MHKDEGGPGGGRRKERRELGRLLNSLQNLQNGTVWASGRQGLLKVTQQVVKLQPSRSSTCCLLCSHHLCSLPQGSGDSTCLH